MIKFNKKYRDYWSCSRFARYITPKKKPYALTMEDWKVYDDEYKKLYPIRFYFTEELLDKLQDYFYFFNNLVYSVDIYLRNRFKAKTHALVSNLETGKWYDYDYRMTACIFDSFTNWMETEYAQSNKSNPSEMIRTHLWESNLICDETMGVEKDNINYGKKTKQALNAIKLFEIYQYCKYQRQPMIDANEMYCLMSDYQVYSDKEYAIEKLDTEYLIKLIENRASLWN